MTALFKPDALEPTIDRILLEAGGDARLAIRRLLRRLETDVSAGYVRRDPAAK